MVATRKQKRDSTIKSVNNTKKHVPFNMKIIYLRFPKLSEKIFQQLNEQTLVSCKKVGRQWLNCIKDHRIYWIRKIQKLSAKFEFVQRILPD